MGRAVKLSCASGGVSLSLQLLSLVATGAHLGIRGAISNFTRTDGDERPPLDKLSEVGSPRQDPPRIGVESNLLSNWTKTSVGGSPTRPGAAGTVEEAHPEQDEDVAGPDSGSAEHLAADSSGGIASFIGLGSSALRFVAHGLLTVPRTVVLTLRAIDHFRAVGPGIRSASDADFVSRRFAPRTRATDLENGASGDRSGVGFLAWLGYNYTGGDVSNGTSMLPVLLPVVGGAGALSEFGGGQGGSAVLQLLAHSSWPGPIIKNAERFFIKSKSRTALALALPGPGGNGNAKNVQAGDVAEQPLKMLEDLADESFFKFPPANGVGGSAGIIGTTGTVARRLASDCMSKDNNGKTCRSASDAPVLLAQAKALLAHQPPDRTTSGEIREPTAYDVAAAVVVTYDQIKYSAPWRQMKPADPHKALQAGGADCSGFRVWLKTKLVVKQTGTQHSVARMGMLSNTGRQEEQRAANAVAVALLMLTIAAAALFAPPTTQSPSLAEIQYCLPKFQNEIQKSTIAARIAEVLQSQSKGAPLAVIAGQAVCNVAAAAFGALMTVPAEVPEGKELGDQAGESVSRAIARELDVWGRDFAQQENKSNKLIYLAVALLIASQVMREVFRVLFVSGLSHLSGVLAWTQTIWAETAAPALHDALRRASLLDQLAVDAHRANKEIDKNFPSKNFFSGKRNPAAADGNGLHFVVEHFWVDIARAIRNSFPAEAEGAYQALLGPRFEHVAQTMTDAATAWLPRFEVPRTEPMSARPMALVKKVTGTSPSKVDHALSTAAASSQASQCLASLLPLLDLLSDEALATRSRDGFETVATTERKKLAKEAKTLATKATQMLVHGPPAADSPGTDGGGGLVGALKLVLELPVVPPPLDPKEADFSLRESNTIADERLENMLRVELATMFGKRVEGDE